MSTFLRILSIGLFVAGLATMAAAAFVECTRQERSAIYRDPGICDIEIRANVPDDGSGDCSVLVCLTIANNPPFNCFECYTEHFPAYTHGGAFIGSPAIGPANTLHSDTGCQRQICCILPGDKTWEDWVFEQCEFINVTREVADSGAGDTDSTCEHVSG
jgi:hypothetical protein